MGDGFTSPPRKSKLSYELKYNKCIKIYIGNKVNYYNKAATILKVAWNEIFIKSTEGLRMKKKTRGQSELFSVMS